MKLQQLGMAMLLVAVTYNACASDEDDIKKSLSEKMKGSKIGAITKTPYAGLYEVVVDGINILYTDAKGQFGVFGKVYDLKTQQNLTEERIGQIRTLDFAKLPLDKAVVSVKGNGSRKLAVFSDPECPYCQKLEKDLQGVTDVTIYTFLFPLTEIHPDAERKAKLVWCAKDRTKAWNDLMLGGKEPAEQAKCDTPFKEIATLADQLFIAGTPGMIFGNGKLVPGGLPQPQIEALLNAATVKQ